MLPIKGRAAQRTGAREQKGYLLPGTNQDMAGTIGKEREKMKKVTKKKFNKLQSDFFQ